MGPGFNRMNDVTVQQTSQGLCRYLQQNSPKALNSNGIVIGYDARHRSKHFAQLAARVFMSQGIKVHLFGQPVPTPFVAAGTLQLSAAGGIMITASHNSKEYNGYKVYYSNGCQIIPPHDSGIAAAIEQNLPLWGLPTFDEFGGGLNPMGGRGLLYDPLVEVSWNYFNVLTEHLCFRGAANQDSAPVVYTPLHGVGLRAVQHAFQSFQLPPPILVSEQASPDPDFPTVSFPNPEEKGTLDLAIETARAAGAKLILANDPDADRLSAAEAVAVPGVSNDSNSYIEIDQPVMYHQFSGNDIGLLLADWVWTNFKQRHPEVSPGQVAMLASTVSSKALAAMATAEGFHFEETLTGFKWLGNRAEQLEAEGYTVLFAFEEAIGYMFYQLHKDKDGVSAAAVFAEMAAQLAAQGSSIAEHLEQLYQRYGQFIYRAGYYVSDPPSKSQGVFAGLRQGGNYPQEVGGIQVTGVRDLGTGVDTTQPDQQPTLPWTAGDLMVTFYLAQGGTLTLRASATEPKLKYYLEVVGTDKEAAQQLAETLEAAVGEQLVQPDRYGLLPQPS
eukprot:jgi/Chrzof1/5299/Cz15g21100.t1_GPM2[v5.2]